MKKTRLLLLSVAALSLVACNENAKASEVNSNASNTENSTLSDDIIDDSVSSDVLNSEIESSDDAYEASESIDWPDEVKEHASTNFDNHFIPYFFCGTESIALDITSKEINSIKFYGVKNSWDKRVFDNANNAFKKENESIENEDEKWILKDSVDSVTDMPVLIATRTYSDGCTLTMELEESTFDKNASILITYEKGYFPPEGASWNSTILTCFNDYLDNYSIPYVYLGNENVENDTAKWDDLNTLTLWGGSYYSALLFGANKAFGNAEGWTSKIVTKTGTGSNGDFTYKVVEAEYILDSKSDKKLTVIVDSSKHSNTGASYGYCKMTITYVKPYVVPTNPDELKWSDEVKANIDSDFSGHSLPFVYLNTDDIEYYYDEDMNSIYLYGGAWNDGVFDHALDQLSGSVKTQDEDGNDIVSTTISETDGCSIDVSIYKNKNNAITYKATLNEKYVSGETKSWNDDVKSVMTSVLQGKSIPFIDLGSTHYTVNKTGNNGFYIKTHVYDAEILEDAVDSIDGVSGWTCIKNAYIEDEVDAFKTYSDGLTIAFKLSANNYNTGTQLLAYCYTKSDLTKTKSNWSESDKEKILDITGTTEIPNIPFLYMGENDYTLYSSDTLIGNVYDVTTMLDYFNKLDDAGYQTISFKCSSSQFNITAEYIDNKGNKTKIAISYYNNYSSKISSAMLKITYTAA